MQAPSLRRIGEAVALAASAVACPVLLVRLAGYGWGRDHGIFAAVAQAIAAGGAPYRDAWDYKPPAIYLVFTAAEALFGPGAWGLRILECLALASLAAPAVWLARRLVGDARAALPAVALALLGHVGLGFWHTGQPETFGGVALAWALPAAILGADPTLPRGRRALALALAGGAYAVAALFKPTLALALPVTLAAALWPLRREARLGPAAAPLVGAALAGFALPFLAVGAWLAAAGALPDALAALTRFAPAHAALGWEKSSAFVLVLRAIGDFVAQIQPWGTLGAVALVAFGRRAEATHALGVAGAALAGVAVQAMFFRYHYDAAALPLGLLGGLGLWAALGALLDRRLGLEPALGFLALTALLQAEPTAAFGTQDTPIDREEADDAARRSASHGRRLADWSEATVNEAGRWIRENTPPGAPMYVWGYEPLVYVLAEQPASSRYIYDEPQRVSWDPDARRSLLADLAARPPAVLVVQHGDRFPFLTGNDRDSAEELAAFPELQTIANGYRLARTVDYLDLLVRTDATASPTSATPAPAPIQPGQAGGE